VSLPPDGRPAVTAGRPRQDAWDGRPWRWDAYFIAVFAGTVILVGFEGPGTVAAQAVTGAAYLSLAAWYALFGRLVLFSERAGAWRGEIYLAGLIPLFAVAAAASTVSAFLLLAISPQCFMAGTFRRAVAAVVVLNTTPVVTLVAVDQPSRGDVISAIAVAVAGIAFSLAFGSWVLQIIDQNTERGRLIEQLEATRAELAAAERQAGVLAERNRLAGDLHDTIAQDLTSVVMLVQAAEAAVAAGPAQAREHLALAAGAARDSLAQVRGLVDALVPAELAQATIIDALARLTARAGPEPGHAADFLVEGEPRPVTTGAEVVLLRVCQEALTNVRKHARAGHASVRLAYADAEVRLEVTDDGAGFDPDQASGGYGLRGMRSRAAEAGGRLTVHSAPGSGTSVTVAVPAVPA
jgi:signal transduction histidine kinase